MTPDPDRASRMAQVFDDRFGGAPTAWCRAPGRVDLMGSHTDYNLGFVLTLPLDLDVWIAARPRPDRTVRLHSSNLERDCAFGLDGAPSTQGWCLYAQAVATVFEAEGLPASGFDGVVHGTVPLGGGLSSSAALECAVATALEVLAEVPLDPVRKARLCQRAENEVVGVPCGILDQYTSCVGVEGHALLLDCRDLTSRLVRLPEDIRVVICDTRAKRELAGSEYGERRAQCEEGAQCLGVAALRDVTPEELAGREEELPAVVARRCRFIVEENARVERLAEALPRGDRAVIRQVCADSFRGAVNQYAIGVPAMQQMMEAMSAAPGVIGARQAGAGFGGCMVAFVDAGDENAFAAAVRSAYRQASGCEPGVHVARSGAGAGLLSPPPLL